jgi:hypothetical protein
MIDFTEILNTYVESDAYLGRKEANTRTPAGRNKWARRRRFNDQAHFLMLFAQLEQHVDRLVAELLRRKRVLVGWRDRRLWQDAELRRLKFMQKVSLLTERGQAAHNRINVLYHDYRCAIAHGNIAAVGPLALPVMATELRNLART